MKRTIEDFDLEGKKVIIRVDFNVPMKDGQITDDNRIKESLKTIRYAADCGAKVILLSHLGRIKNEEDKEKNSLEPVYKRLGDLLKIYSVSFCHDTQGYELEAMIEELQNGDILLVENTRFEDVPVKRESTNELTLGRYWASLGDIFINDAFGTSHRAHASNVGIASNISCGIGYLVEKEVNIMKNAIDNPKRPFTVILGGAKVSDKIGVIENLGEKADYILIGGAMAYTFLKAQNLEVGKSLVEEESIEFCKQMLEKYPNKIILPTDVVIGLEMKEDTKVKDVSVKRIKPEMIGLDIGKKTVKLFEKYLKESATIIWNGPVGMFELKPFRNGTKSLFDILSNLQATTILGGGDTASAAINMGYKEKFTHISTGGGASLEMLEGKSLPGIEIIEDR